MTSFLQTETWAEFQRSLGRKVFRIEETNIIQYDLPFRKNYLYVPFTSYVPELRHLAEQQKSIFVKAEPLSDELARALMHREYRKSSKNIQPNKTVVLDLMRSEDKLLGAMHYKTRYNIKVAEKRGVHVSCITNHETFWELMQKTTKRDKFSSHPKEYYKRLLALCKLYVAWSGEMPLAAAMILTHGDCAYYLHGASDYRYRALMAPYALHWHITLNLKLLNFKLYDLWGIDTQKWPGVTRFKLGWGGRVVEYPGAFDLVVSKLWYYAYNAFRAS